jgi:large subunit ribosomal protein L35
MPKLKTNKGVKKRVKITKKGKLKRGRAFGSHLMSGKTGKRRRKLKRSALISKADKRKVLRMLGH